MKRNILLTLIVILTLGATVAEAQLGDLKKKIKDKVKTEQNKPNEATENKTNESSQDSNSGDTRKRSEFANNADFLFVGANDLEDKKTSELRVCSEGYSLTYPVQEKFKQWISDISETAMLRMMQTKRCELLGYLIQDKPGYKHRSADSFAEEAQGMSVYRVEDDKLVLVKKFEASQFYIVVVPEVAKNGLKLADLNLCGAPDTIKHYRRKTASVSNCHDLKQSLYVFESYKNYPGPMQRNSVIFNSADFESLNKQGKFKGLVVYKLAGEELVPFK